MANKNDRLVVAYYNNKAAADRAVDGIKSWDKADDDVKLGAIAVMTLDKKGELHADEVGQRSTKSGVLWGTAVGAAVGLLAGGIGVIPGAIAGAAGGGGLGALDHKSVGMTDADRAKMIDNLKQGGAAVAVMADDFEVVALQDKMADLGGTATTFVVPDETADVLTKAAAAQAAATEAVDEAIDESVDEVQDAVEEASRAIDVDVPDLDDTAKDAVGKIAAVTGMSVAEAAKFYDAGIDKASGLLQQAATPQGREELAAATGLDAEEVLTQAKKLDLMRVKDVGVKYAALLLASGVDTVPELATRNAANLAAKMEVTNEADGLVEELPSADQVGGWVDQAKELPRMLYY